MLSDTRTTVAGERSSKKAPLLEAEARALLAGVETVLIARGRQFETRPAKEVSLEDLKGPTGNFRAPMLRAGKRLLVGFNEEALRSLV